MGWDGADCLVIRAVRCHARIGGASRPVVVTADLHKLVERIADENPQSTPFVHFEEHHKNRHIADAARRISIDLRYADTEMVETVVLTHTQFVSSPAFMDLLIQRYAIGMTSH